MTEKKPPLPWRGKEPPPVAQRPRCPQCDKPLRPWIYNHWERRALDRVVPAKAGTAYQQAQAERPAFGMVVVSREWRGTYDAYGAFCTLRCTDAFANAAHKAGFRRKRAA